MFKHMIAFAAVVGLVFALAPAAQADLFSVVTFNDDAGSGISASNTYTHLIDLNGDGSPATINGVPFESDAYFSNEYINGTNFSLTQSDYNDITTNYSWAAVDGTGTGMAGLTSNMYYLITCDHGAHQSLTLTGLTPGQAYDLRFYSKEWGSRWSLVTASGATIENYTRVAKDYVNPYPYDECQTATGEGVPYEYLQYEYTPVGSTILVEFTLDNGDKGSQHMYGFSNQVVPEPATLVLMGLGGLGLLLRRRRR